MRVSHNEHQAGRASKVAGAKLGHDFDLPRRCNAPSLALSTWRPFLQIERPFLPNSPGTLIGNHSRVLTIPVAGGDDTAIAVEPRISLRRQPGSDTTQDYAESFGLSASIISVRHGPNHEASDVPRAEKSQSKSENPGSTENACR